MKSTQIVFLLFLSVTSILAEVYTPSGTFMNFEDEFERITHPFGGIHLKKETPEGTDSIVYLPEKGLFSEQEHFDEVRKSLAYYHQNADFVRQQQNDAILNCTLEDKSDYLKFFPKFIGSLNSANTSITYAAPCFQNNTVSLNIVDDTTVEVIHQAENPTSDGCADTYFYSTLINYHMESYLIHGTHKTTYKVAAEELEQIKTVGIFVFRTCDKLKNIIPDLFKTAFLFLGEIELAAGIHSHNKSVPTPFDIHQSIQFTYEATGYQWVKRPNNVLVEIDESLVNSGDFFAVKKFDGTGDLVEYGTGSHVNHCTVALRVDGELYIAESNAAFEWPVAGIQMNPYKTWIQWAQNQGYLVTWLPLKPEFAAKFNQTSAYEWFKSIEGLPYGIHNYIYGWLDTSAHNYPPVLAPEFLATMFGFLEKSQPDAIAKIFTMGLNKRLGTENLTVAGVAEEAFKRGLTMPDVYAMVEQDGWEYPDGVSYQCSGFVTGLLKAAGLFGDNYVNAVEFTPKDVYQLEFYDPSPTIPENCKAADPVNPYCQIMGGYRMDFPFISTVQVHAHMNEACWTEAPLYEIYPPGC